MKKLIIIFALLMLILISNLYAQAPVDIKMKSKYDISANDTIALEINMKSVLALGGIDIQFQYPDTLLTYLYTEQREGLNNWEFFTIDIDTLLDLVRIVSIADIVNGPNHPAPEDFFPDGVIASIYFETAGSFSGDSLTIPMNFYWLTCGDNALSNTSGNILYLDRRIYDNTGILIWDEDNDDAFPEPSRSFNTGTSDSCITGEPIPRVIDYHYGILTNYPALCGDVDFSTAIDISDVVFLINFIFAGGAAPDPLLTGDVDCSGEVDISDAVYLIAYIFSGGSAPCETCL